MTAPMQSDPGAQVMETWRCLTCDGRSYARIDERKDDGSFGPGDLVRCVNCKAVYRLSLAPGAELDGLVERLETYWWKTESDRLLGQEAATAIRALATQNAALKAERETIIKELDRCEIGMRSEHNAHMRPWSLLDRVTIACWSAIDEEDKRRAEAAEAQVAALTAQVAKLEGERDAEAALDDQIIAALDRAEAAESELSRMRGLLKPLSDAAYFYDANPNEKPPLDQASADTHIVWAAEVPGDPFNHSGADYVGVEITVADCRAARAALHPQVPDKQEERT